MAIQLPIYFKLDHSKARIVNTFVYGGIFAVLYIIYDNNHFNNYMKLIMLVIIYMKIYLISTIISIIYYYICYLSMRIYEKKESM